MSAGADRGVSVREQVRRLGCVSPHNQRIFTSRLQPGAQRVSPPQSGTAGLRGFRAICRSRPICCGQRCQRRLPGRCGASARVTDCPPRCYRHSWTRGACRSRLVRLPAHTARRAHPRPKICGQYGKVVDLQSHPAFLQHPVRLVLAWLRPRRLLAPTPLHHHSMISTPPCRILLA